MKRTAQRWLFLVVAALGGLAGMGLFTFNYAEGFSYFSTDPKSCNNCHVMNEQYDSWQKGTHHAAAGCVDCHMPTHLVNKLYTKAENGYRHSMRFTFMDFHEPIQITPRNRGIVQQNCVRCHDALTHNLISYDTGKGEGVSCLQCHVHVGHGAR